MKESELYAPVRDWLLANGYTVHVEMFDADIIALKDGKMIVVELKPVLSGVLINQLHNRSAWADEVWAAIASKPENTRALRNFGFGLLRVVNGVVKLKIKAKAQPYRWQKRRTYRLSRLIKRAPAMAHEIAGLPSCKLLSNQRKMRTIPL